MLTKACSRCKRELPSSEFYPHRRMKLGLQSHCKACARAWHKERPDYVKAKNAEFKKKRPGYARDWQRLNKFGVSPDMVAAMLESQCGLCAGCGRKFGESIRENVDHCHKTNRVRGLLCRECNLILGYAFDLPETLLRLAKYLVKTEEQ